MPITRQCAICGSGFTGHPKRKLCSTACRKLWRPPTVLTCGHCGEQFVASHLRRKYCSYICKSRAMVMRPEERKPRAVATIAARRAHGLVNYYISAGKLVRPYCCSECGGTGRIEAAHYDYSRPLLVRWLCRSCHSRWDHREPKGGVQRWQGRPGAVALNEENRSFEEVSLDRLAGKAA